MPPPGSGYPPGYLPTPMSPGGQPLASFLDRLLARLIDGLIIGAVAVVVMVPLFIAFFAFVFNNVEMDASGNPTDEDAGLFFGGFFLLYALVFLLVFAAQYIYDVEMMFRSGQTPGKRVMKIRIVPLDPRERLTRGMAGKRFLVQTVAASCIPLLSIVDGLWQLWDKPYQQCLHDKFATTVVVKVAQ
jgi:uncharacterized RDD family membrane protein YckC